MLTKTEAPLAGSSTIWTSVVSLLRRVLATTSIYHEEFADALDKTEECEHGHHHRYRSRVRTPGRSAD